MKKNFWLYIIWERKHCKISVIALREMVCCQRYKNDYLLLYMPWGVWCRIGRTTQLCFSEGYLPRMKDILLQGILGHSQIDSVVQQVVQVYEETFPGQIAAYYVEGSYADHTSLSTSDIDLVIVFRNSLADRETHRMAEQTWTSEHRGAPEVDITVVDEE